MFIYDVCYTLFFFRAQLRRYVLVNNVQRAGCSLEVEFSSLSGDSLIRNFLSKLGYRGHALNSSPACLGLGGRCCRREALLSQCVNFCAPASPPTFPNFHASCLPHREFTWGGVSTSPSLLAMEEKGRGRARGMFRGVYTRMKLAVIVWWAVRTKSEATSSGEAGKTSRYQLVTVKASESPCHTSPDTILFSFLPSIAVLRDATEQ